MADIKRASIRAYIGATGSGKGVSIFQHLKAEKPTRLAIFDPLHEYGQIAAPVSTVGDALRAMKQDRFRVAWQPDEKTDFDSKQFRGAFNLWCHGAFAAGSLTMLVEELELVTRPTWAPAGWRMCTKRGRHRELQIIAAAQRPADCDKAFLSGCTYVRCFALREHPDRQRMAQALSVPIEQIERLQTVSVSDTATRITYFEADYSSGERGEKTITLRR